MVTYPFTRMENLLTLKRTLAEMSLDSGSDDKASVVVPENFEHSSLTQQPPAAYAEKLKQQQTNVHKCVA